MASTFTLNVGNTPMQVVAPASCNFVEAKQTILNDTSPTAYYVTDNGVQKFVRAGESYRWQSSQPIPAGTVVGTIWVVSPISQPLLFSFTQDLLGGAAPDTIQSVISTLRGGSTSRVLTKVSPTDFDFNWQAGGGPGGTVSADVTSNHLSVLSQAISVVSNALSVETAGRVAANNTLSANLASATTGLRGGVSAQVLTKNTTADFDYTWKTPVGGSLSADITSNHISVVSAAAAVALALANAVSGHVDTLSNQISVLSQAVSVISQQVSLLSVGVDRVSNALSNETSNRVSAVNVVSNAASIVSVGVDRVSNALSNEISNRVSADNALSVNINTVSNAISIVSQALSVETANRVSLANAVSIISQQVSVISVQVASAISIANAASNAASVVSVAAANATSIANAASNAASIVSVGVDRVSNALSNETSNRISAINVVSNAASIVSVGVDRVSNAASNALSVANVASNLFSTLRGGLTAQVLTKTTNADFAWGWATPVGGTLSADITSNHISAVSAAAANAASIANAASNAASIVSVAAANATSIANAVSAKADTLSNQISVLSQQVSVISQQVSALSQAVSIVSVQVASALSIANAASNAASIVSQALSVETANRISALSTVANNISILSVNLASVQSQVSTALSQASAALSQISVISQQVSVLSQAHSVLSTHHATLSQNVSVISAALGGVQMRVASAGNQSLAVSTSANVSGLSISVAAGGIYQVDGIVYYQMQTSVQTVNFGATFPVCSVAAGRMFGDISVGPNALSITEGNAAYFDETGSGSMFYSVVVPVVNKTLMVDIRALFNVSAAGTIQITGRTVGGSTAPITILRGSFVRAFRII